MKKFEVSVKMFAVFFENTKEVADYHFPLYKAQISRIWKSRDWPPFVKGQFNAGKSNKSILIIGDANKSVVKFWL